MHRVPKDGDTKTTDAPRLRAAMECCLACLMGDLRLEAPYRAWYAAHEIERYELAAEAAEGTGQQEDARAALWRVLYGPPLPAEEAALAEKLREMGVPWPWVAPALLSAAFPITHSNARLPREQRRELGALVEMRPGAAPGRLPTKEAALIRRHVIWWYRRKIKHPEDKLPELEREELARTGQRTIARRHSTILQGIQHAERLLELFRVGERRDQPTFSKVAPPNL
jgi:hypothetical protein